MSCKFMVYAVSCSEHDVMSGQGSQSVSEWNLRSCSDLQEKEIFYVPIERIINNKKTCFEKVKKRTSTVFKQLYNITWLNSYKVNNIRDN